MTYAILGDIQFDVTHITGLDATNKQNFVEHPKIQDAPTLQLVGRELGTLKMGVRFNWLLGDPDASLTALQAAWKAGKAYALVLGSTGTFAGNYVIEQMDVKMVKTLSSGATVLVDVSLSLKEWRTGVPPKSEKVKPPFKKIPTTLTAAGEILDPRDAK